MRYIGPFFRMNSLSQDEISGQLFYLSKESVKTLVLNSKCGLLAQIRSSKKSSINDISILSNFSPLLCLYRKASPMFIHSKTSHGFDESSFKKEINPSTNAFMTLCLLELSDYYSNYSEDNRNVVSLEKPYMYLAKEQLQFYSENLRNDEGLFVSKKNVSDANSKGFSLINKDDKFKFSDQAFMMAAYYLYSHFNKSDAESGEYSKFANEILSLFVDYKDALYDLSFDENVQILLALNIYYKYSKSLVAKELIIDLGDFLINKFEEKDYYLDNLDDCALFSISLMESYKHTGIISFKDGYSEISEKLISLYSSDKNMFLKIPDKKEIKYSCLEINLYLLCLIMYSSEDDKKNELKPIISALYRKLYVNSGLLTSWPDAPTLDEVERYRNLSLKADDMLDETFFRMPMLPTPKSSGVASIFLKTLTYSKKKGNLAASKLSFDSNKNMFSFYLIIYLLKDKIKKLMGFEINKTKNKKEDPDQKSEKKPRLDDKENPALNKDSNSSDNNISDEKINNNNSKNNDIPDNRDIKDDESVSTVDLTEVDAIPIVEIMPSTDKIKLNATLPQSDKNQKYKKNKKK